MKITGTLLLGMLLCTTAVSAQRAALKSINQDDLKEYMTYFASDELKGRVTGTEENHVAARYIQSNIERMGLKPLPETGSYFQDIPLVSVLLSPEGTGLRIQGNGTDTGYTTDSILFLVAPSDTVNVSGNVVFAGYGYVDAESGYNDFQGVDLDGKIVVVMTENPEVAESQHESVMFDFMNEYGKIMAVAGKNPAALVFVYNPLNSYTDAYDSRLVDMIPGGVVGTREVLKEGPRHVGLHFPILFITRHAANLMLSPAGSSLDQLEQMIIDGGQPHSLAIDNTLVEITARFVRSPILSPNVIGIVEGSDPVLKDECVIYSAHFDHVKPDSHGEINNGADDNASGSMALLEVAEAYTRLKSPPRRTVIFAWVNAEEKGLLGSQHYTENPVISMENTLLDINLDMVGRSRMPSDTGLFMGYKPNVTERGEIMVYTAHESSQVIEIMNRASEKSGIKVIDMGAELELGGSDHMSFLEKGVPALFFNSGLHSDLHGPGDDVERIDFDKMERVSKMVFLIGYDVANRTERIVLDMADGQ